MKTKFALTMALAGSVMLVGCSDDDNVAENPATQNILEIAVAFVLGVLTDVLKSYRDPIYF